MKPCGACFQNNRKRLPRKSLLRRYLALGTRRSESERRESAESANRFSKRVIVAAVEAINLFVKVALQMLCADFVVLPYDSALEQRERVLD